MRYYKEILEEKLKVASDNPYKEKYHYHTWTSQSIEKFWQIQTNSLIKEQFYPVDYWIDLINWFTKLIKYNRIEKILDIGCGIGNLIDVLRKYYLNAKIIGIDLSDESLETAKNRFRNFNNIEFKVGRISDIPIENESIDLVTCTEVLEHLNLEEFYNGFKEVSRILKKKGFFLATIPFYEKLTFVSCPECGCIFHPFQHMIFEVSYDDIKNICKENKMEVIAFYQAFNREIPQGLALKKILKKTMIKILPDYILARIFPKSGATGFLAKKL